MFYYQKKEPWRRGRIDSVSGTRPGRRRGRTWASGRRWTGWSGLAGPGPTGTSSALWPPPALPSPSPSSAAISKGLGSTPHSKPTGPSYGCPLAPLQQPQHALIITETERGGRGGTNKLRYKSKTIGENSPKNLDNFWRMQM